MKPPSPFAALQGGGKGEETVHIEPSVGVKGTVWRSQQGRRDGEQSEASAHQGLRGDCVQAPSHEVCQGQGEGASLLLDPAQPLSYCQCGLGSPWLGGTPELGTTFLPSSSEPGLHSCPPLGKKSLILGSKGCSNPGHQKIKNVTVYSRGPGIVASSYVNVCDSDLCNKANSSGVLVTSLTPPGMGSGDTEPQGAACDHS